MSAPRNSLKADLQQFPPTKHKALGFTLVEVLIYMAMLFLILGLGYLAMYRSMDASSGLRRNTDDIRRAVDAGERWREDVRHATKPLRLEHATAGEIVLRIPEAHAEVAYRFSSGTVSRRIGNGEWTPVLDKVKTSAFIDDRRKNTTAWLWEVELQTYRKSLTRTRPLFTFIAAAPNHLAP
jgi:type II secretory pathway pseudopilin PulG